MGNETKFKQHLKISNESKSSLSSVSARKKHKPVSSLVSLDKAEANSKCRVQKGDKRECTKRNTKDSLTSDDLKKEASKEKSTKTSGGEFSAVEEVRLFMGSVLEDLKVKSENLFTWMADEMRKLAANDADLQREDRKSDQLHVDNQDNCEEKAELHDQNGFRENKKLHHQKSVRNNNNLVQPPKDFEGKSGMRGQISSDKSFQRSTESNDESGLKIYYQTLGDLDGYGNPTRGEDMASHVKPNTQYFAANHGTQMHHQKNFLSGRKSEGCNGGALVNFAEGKSTPSSDFHDVLEERDAYDQGIEYITSSLKKNGEDSGLTIDSSMYLILSPALSGQPSVDSQGLDISSCNNTQPTVAENRRGIDLGGANQHGYFLGAQIQEPKRSFAELSSENVDSFVQRSTLNSSIGNEFPGCSIPSDQTIFDRGNNIVAGLTMDFSGGSYDLSFK